MINKFMKINLKIILAIVLTAIICISGTVFATGYFAKDIVYTRAGSDIKNVEEALNELYNKSLNNIEIITSNKVSTISRAVQKNSIVLEIPQNLDCKNAILIITRSSYWYDEEFADNIVGDFEKITEIYKQANGCNTGDSGKSTTIQAGTNMGIYYVENLMQGGKINIASNSQNNSQIQGVLLKVN